MKRVYLGIDDLAAKGVPFKRAQIYRKIREGTFPRPIKWGSRRSAFLESDIDKWVEERIAERNAPAKRRQAS